MAVVDLGRMSLGLVMQAATQVAPLICAKQYWYLIGYNTQSLLTLDLQENRNSTVVSEKLHRRYLEPKEVEFVVDVISSLTSSTKGERGREGKGREGGREGGRERSRRKATRSLKTVNHTKICLFTNP